MGCATNAPPAARPRSGPAGRRARGRFGGPAKRRERARHCRFCDGRRFFRSAGAIRGSASLAPPLWGGPGAGSRYHCSAVAAAEVRSRQAAGSGPLRRAGEAARGSAPRGGLRDERALFLSWGIIFASGSCVPGVPAKGGRARRASDRQSRPREKGGQSAPGATQLPAPGRTRGGGRVGPPSRRRRRSGTPAAPRRGDGSGACARTQPRAEARVPRQPGLLRAASRRLAEAAASLPAPTAPKGEQSGSRQAAGSGPLRRAEAAADSAPHFPSRNGRAFLT